MVFITRFSSFLGILTIPKEKKDHVSFPVRRKTQTKNVKCVNELLYGNEAVDRRQRWQEQEPFQKNAYFEEVTPISSNQGTNTNEQSVEEELNEGEDDAEESEDGIPEY